MDLTKLDLTGCDIGDEAVPFISQFSSLIELQLAATKITDTGVEMLGRLRLRKLNLGSCRVSDRGLSAIASITSLSSLDLTCTMITDTALQAVGKLLNLQELFLTGCTGLTDTGLVALQPLCALQLLDLQWCDALTPAGVATALSSSNATIRMPSQKIKDLFIYV
jgi:Leucine-rich repeat (LRR) protein